MANLSGCRFEQEHIHPVVLEAAGLESAQLLLVTTPGPMVTHAIVDHARRVRPDLRIVARAEGHDQMVELHEMGVYEVVNPQLEAGLEITRQALVHLAVAPADIEHFTDIVRHELYAPLEGAGSGAAIRSLAPNESDR